MSNSYINFFLTTTAIGLLVSPYFTVNPEYSQILGIIGVVVGFLVVSYIKEFATKELYIFLVLDTGTSRKLLFFKHNGAPYNYQYARRSQIYISSVMASSV